MSDVTHYLDGPKFSLNSARNPRHHARSIFDMKRTHHCNELRPRRTSTNRHASRAGFTRVAIWAADLH